MTLNAAMITLAKGLLAATLENLTVTFVVSSQ